MQFALTHMDVFVKILLFNYFAPLGYLELVGHWRLKTPRTEFFYRINYMSVFLLVLCCHNPFTKYS